MLFGAPVWSDEWEDLRDVTIDDDDDDDIAKNIIVNV